VIQLLWPEGVKTKEICGRTRVEYGDKCMKKSLEIFSPGQEAYKDYRIKQYLQTSHHNLITNTYLSVSVDRFLVYLKRNLYTY